MKRSEFLRHLRKHGCVLIREGASHSWWGNPIANRRSSVPRHNELSDILARKICKDLAIPFTR
jgi:mRNA interferase HicA